MASLIFAAARFADVPELRELRSLFTERYGNFLECHVNKEVVTHVFSILQYLSINLKLQLYFFYRDLENKGILFYTVSPELKVSPTYNGDEDSVDERYSIRIWYRMECKGFGAEAIQSTCIGTSKPSIEPHNILIFASKPT